MAVFEHIFTYPRVGRVHRLFQKAIATATVLERAERAAGIPNAGASRRELLRAYGQWQRELDDLALATSKNATRYIRQNLRATQKRPDTGAPPHLRDHIRCRPAHTAGRITTGEVGIADVDELNKVINPLTPQYGPYWMAQEYGSKNMVGRAVYGYFFGTGYAGPPSLPDPQFRGHPHPPHPIFVSGAAGAAAFGSVGFSGGPGARGGRGRRMLISTEIQPRRFIEYGADRAYKDWLAGLRASEAATMAKIAGVFGP